MLSIILLIIFVNHVHVHIMCFNFFHHLIIITSFSHTTKKNYCLVYLLSIKKCMNVDIVPDVLYTCTRSQQLHKASVRIFLLTAATFLG